MAFINWALFTEQAVGRGHATLADVINRSLRQVLTVSGADPDLDFAGFAKATHTHVVADISNLATAATGITKVGTIDTGVWQATPIAAAYLGAHTHTFAQITTLPSTLAGYGITDAYTKAAADALLAGKAAVATTLAGYGITDALANSGFTAGQIIYGQAGGASAKRTLTAGASISITENTGAATVTLAVTTVPWGSLTGSPTTLAGYAIADAYTQTAVNALLAALNASNLTTGTVPNGRFPAVLPALDGSALTNLTAPNLIGTIASARLVGGYTGITGLGTLTVGLWNATVIGPTFGGTGLATYALGDVLYASATNVLSALAGNVTATKKYLSQIGSGAASAAPTWAALVAADVSDLTTAATGITKVGTLSVGAVPASLVTAGTFGAGAFVFAGAVSGITTLTATTLAGTLAAGSQPGITGIGTLTVGAVPASLVTAGTFPAGAFVFAGAVSGITTLTATSLVGPLAAGPQTGITGVGTLTAGIWNATAITDAFLATIATAGKVANSATTATSANTASAIVARDGSGNFSAGTITAALAGTAATATALATARTINGVLFDGTGDLTIAASAATLTGLTLAANVLYSSLVAVGILAAPHMTAPVVDSGGLTVTAGGLTVTAGGVTVAGTSAFTGAVNFSQSTRTLTVFATAGAGALLDGYTMQVVTAGKALNLATSNNLGDKLILGYYDTGGSQYRSAMDVACTNGFATLNLLPAGGTVAIGAALTVTGAATLNGGLTVVGAASVSTTLAVTGIATFSNTVNFSSASRTLALFSTAGAGALLDGYTIGMGTGGKTLNIATTSTFGDKVIIGYYDTGAATFRSAFVINCGNGLQTLELMTAGGVARVGATGATDLVVAGGGAALATTATAGFLYASSCAGTPTGAPTGYTGTVPLVLDTTGSKLWARIGGTWKSVTLT